MVSRGNADVGIAVAGASNEESVDLSSLISILDAPPKPKNAGGGACSSVSSSISARALIPQTNLENANMYLAAVR